MKIKKIIVIGAGIMGAGIAQVAAQSGFDVLMVDISEELVQKGLRSIQQGLSKGVEKGKIKKEDADAALRRVKTSIRLEDARDSDVTIEAVVENMDLKKKIFRKLDEVCPKEAILTSNTSSLSITEMASATSRPAKVVGMHFFNPAPLMKLVEVIRGRQTSDDTVAEIRELALKFGKTPIVVKDVIGFAVNRVLTPLLNEAMYALQEGVASVEDIDTGVKLGLNHPMGPFELADLIGLDTILYLMDIMHDELGERFRPCPLLRNMVRAGHLGRKSGRGFYDYTKKP
jgi:3-hydroxybutyryl-CoA dehydrogenase